MKFILSSVKNEGRRQEINLLGNYTHTAYKYAYYEQESSETESNLT